MTPSARKGSALAASALALTLNSSGAFAFTATFSWCQGSPRFMLNGVPSGTANLQFAMMDINKPAFHHGGGSVAFHGQTELACGAFTSTFIGPSPPPGEVHTYQFTIKALGPNGAVLATATARRKFPE